MPDLWAADRARGSCARTRSRALALAINIDRSEWRDATMNLCEQRTRACLKCDRNCFGRGLPTARMRARETLTFLRSQRRQEQERIVLVEHAWHRFTPPNSSEICDYTWLCVCARVERLNLIVPHTRCQGCAHAITAKPFGCRRRRRRRLVCVWYILISGVAGTRRRR